MIWLVGCQGNQPANVTPHASRGLSSFATRLRDYILSDGKADLFDRLALELFGLQFQNNPAYRKICEARGMTPLLVKHWNQIPVVPTAAFKELELTSLPTAERSTTFHSSGTTEQKNSRHYHSVESLEAYEASLWTWFKSHFDMGSEFIFLTPNGNAAPRSSLVHMFETIRQKTGGDGSSAFFGEISADGSWTVDLTVLQKLKHACNMAKPVTLLGTAFSFVHLLDHMTENGLQFRLPFGSSVMETGGYKNRSRILPQAELHALITDRLGVMPEKIICEYGKSESEFRFAAGARPCIFRFPPWARVQIISPETGQEVAEGETAGIIRLLIWPRFSVAAVQTEDHIRREER